jgi:hypothetical protein
MKIYILLALLLSSCTLRTGQGQCGDSCGDKGYTYSETFSGTKVCKCGN